MSPGLKELRRMEMLSHEDNARPYTPVQLLLKQSHTDGPQIWGGLKESGNIS